MIHKQFECEYIIKTKVYVTMKKADEKVIIYQA